jgi:hypothetical protein
MNPKREVVVEVKDLESKKVPDYVERTCDSIVHLLGAREIDVSVEEQKGQCMLVFSNTKNILDI